MNHGNASDLSKLRDIQLPTSGGSISVIIEVRSEPVTLLGREPGHRSLRPGVREIVGGTLGTGGGDFEAVRACLATMKLPQEAVALDRAGAFVASLDAQQVRALAAMPEVAAIRPNRSHRSGRSSGL